MNKPAQVFAQFPEFTALNYKHKRIWEEIIAEFPPISDYSFAVLMTWWSSLDTVKIALLNGNIVICYWIPGDEKNSGLSLIGRRKIDESICTIFDWQKARGDKPRLVHVPEFVLEQIEFPELYRFDSDRGYDECVLSTERFASLEKMPMVMRSRVRRFMLDYAEEDVDIRELDIESPSVKEAVLTQNNYWKRQGFFNNLGSYEYQSFIVSIQNAERLGFSALGIYVCGVLHGFLIYQEPAQSSCVLINYARFSYELPRLFEASIYCLAKYFRNNQVLSVNIDSDYNDRVLRAAKVVLGAKEYFRKYTIQPR